MTISCMNLITGYSISGVKMIVGKLSDCEVNDLVYVRLSRRLYFVLIRSKRLVYFCSDVSQDMKSHCLRWEWISTLRYDILRTLRLYPSISISTGNFIRRWPSKDICFEKNGLQTIGICKEEWEDLMFYMYWISVIVKMPVETYPHSDWTPEQWMGINGENIFNDPKKCDAVIAIGTKQYHVSKKCLSKSPVLHIMLTSRNWKDSTLTAVRLTEMDEVMPYMESVLRFMHSGKIEITRQNMMPLILISDKYNIRELDVLCERAMNNFVFSGMPIEQIIQWWVSTKELNFNSMCKEYLQLNLLSVFSSELFWDMGLDELVSLLEGNTQVIESEYTLFKHVFKWLKMNDRMADLTIIMPHIKLLAMSMDELTEIEGFPLENEVKDSLYEAMKFHASPSSTRRKEQCSKRIYTSKGLNIPAKKAPFAKYSNISSTISQLRVMYRTSSGPNEIHILTEQLAGNNVSSVEISIVVHAIENKIKFVKGVYNTILPITGKCGHKLIINIPKKNFPSRPTSLTPDTITVIPNYIECHTPEAARRKLCF